MEQQKVMGPVKVWESGGMRDYSEKFVEDCYVDAYTGFGKGKSFSLEVVTALVNVVDVDFRVTKSVEFRVVVRVFDSARDLMEFIESHGADKIIEAYYAV